MKYIFFLLISINTIFANETINIFGNFYKPPKIWTKDGKHYGILVEVLKEVEKELDVGFNIQTYPWARSYKMALNKKGGIVGISVTKKRKEIFDFNKVALFFDTIVLITKKDKEFKFDSLKDLKGKRVGYCRGCSFGKTFEEAKKYFISVETDDSREQRLKMLLNDKLDVALLGPGSFALATICKESNLFKYDDFTVLKKPLVVDPNYLAFAKELNKKELLKKFDRILQKKVDDGTVEKIIKKLTKM